MLNEDRIRLMTKMAAFDAKEGKKSISICKYFKIDYVSFNLLKSAISVTIAYGIVVALWVFYKADFFVENIHKMNLVLLAENIIKYYLVCLGAYMMISYGVFSYKYSKAKKEVKTYYGHLKRMSKLYEKEEQRLENTTFGRGR